MAVPTPSRQVSLRESVRSTASARLALAGGASVSAVSVHRNSDGIAEALGLVEAGEVWAVLCPTDPRALEVLRAARGLGLSVPRDVSVTGCDGVLPGLDLIGPTSVRLRVEELATRVVAHLVGLMREAPAVGGKVQTRAQVGTGGPPAHAARAVARPSRVRRAPPARAATDGRAALPVRTGSLLLNHLPAPWTNHRASARGEKPADGARFRPPPPPHGV
ncbi:hypothetical protein Cpa01nite_16650 [Cellulomonas pakistanensis]|uniref:Transcriptional regulator LacI/GalR-like sensor domain-containing protein n=1 Tax=Cellulomonas pakistanensis TaxID=992287 RepID=A0A919P8E9_9CELL|nr:hypothetical protein Cpa01nite_16650 [Cellulomonas pakistanensis]